MCAQALPCASQRACVFCSTLLGELDKQVYEVYWQQASDSPFMDGMLRLQLEVYGNSEVRRS